jgi:hypothetical protein
VSDEKAGSIDTKRDPEREHALTTLPWKVVYQKAWHEGQAEWHVYGGKMSTGLVIIPVPTKALAEVIVEAVNRAPFTAPDPATLAREVETLKRERDGLKRDFEAELAGRLDLREQYGAKEGETMFDFIARLYSGSCRAESAEAERDALKKERDEAVRTLNIAGNHFDHDNAESARLAIATWFEKRSEGK